MAFDTSIITQYLIKYLVNPLFWLVLIIIFLGGIVLILYIKKRRALQFAAVEFPEYKEGDLAINTGIKCGWFGINWYIKGLWTTGREVMRTSSGEIIEEFSESDFKIINGKRGVVFHRDPISRNLFPISKLMLEDKSKAIIARVPPAEFIDNACKIVKDSAEETSDRMEKMLFYGTIAFIVIGLIIAVIVIGQMNKTNTEKVTEMFKDGGKMCLDMCSNNINEVTKMLQDKGITATGGSTAP